MKHFSVITCIHIQVCHEHVLVQNQKLIYVGDVAYSWQILPLLRNRIFVMAVFIVRHVIARESWDVENLPIKCDSLHVSFLLILFHHSFLPFYQFFILIKCVPIYHFGYFAIRKHKFCPCILFCKQKLIFPYMNIFPTSPECPELTSVSLLSAWRAHVNHLI